MKASVTFGFMCLAALLGCSSASSTTSGAGGSAPSPAGCSTDPFACPAGQTCWASQTAGTEYKCLNSGPGKLGAACQLVYDSPTCGDGMTCYDVGAATVGMGVCTPYCDATTPAHACPSHEACVAIELTVGGIPFHACQPPASTGAGGHGAGGHGAGGKAAH